jgi:hypothetical protein
MKRQALIIGVTWGLCLVMASWSFAVCKGAQAEQENAGTKVQILAMKYIVQGTEYTAHPATADDLKEAGLSVAACPCGKVQCHSASVWRCLTGISGTCVWYPTQEGCEQTSR